MKKYLLIFLIGFGITIFNNCLSFETETHDFEGWSNETKLNFVEPNWFWSPDARINRISTAYSGHNSFYAHGGEIYTTGMSIYIPVPTTTLGGFSVWLKFFETSTGWTGRWGIALLTGLFYPNTQWSLGCKEWIGNELELYESYNPTTTIEMGSWKNIKIEWWFVNEILKVRYKIDDHNFTDWLNAPSYNTKTPNWVNIMNLDNSAYKVLYDYIEIYDNSEIGACNSSVGCIFCNTESECLAQNCIWIDNPFPNTDFCIYGGSSSTIFQATDTQFHYFYIDNSFWSTPTEMIEKLASSTSRLFVLISGILNNFNDRFNNTTAQSYGIEYGEAIPKIRGYAYFFNNLIGIDLPIAEIFLIYLTFLFAIIIFRVVRIILKLIPFT